MKIKLFELMYGSLNDKGKIYNAIDKLPSNATITIEKDKEGRIWLKWI